jgi:hypothetical protein
MPVRRIALVCVVLAVAAVPAAAAEPIASERCRTASILRFRDALYFHHTLRLRRPTLRNLQGVALERACDDGYVPGEPLAPWVPVRVFAIDGIGTTAAVAPNRRQVVFYNPYVCSPRLGETRFLRCLRRH